MHCYIRIYTHREYPQMGWAIAKILYLHISQFVVDPCYYIFFLTLVWWLIVYLSIRNVL